MTIKKKPMTIKKPAAAVDNGAVADRFKLNAPDAASLKRASANAKATTAAFVFGLVALAAVGILTYMLWKHWEFLMPA